MLRVWNCIETQHEGWLMLLAAAVCFLTSLVTISYFSANARSNIVRESAG